ncbi:hypothetical protein [Enterobacter oligotrophicus]|uniref:hypothetical protein n=1 Tax=Enterobacter oligotrophicus TaxID=2478464 RepID=UPI0012609912|nr:hypothetical protein [Enterobacter oligotrophicus]
MSRPAKWSLRLLVFLAIMFVLMLSGVFDPLSESLKYTVTNLMNYIPAEKLESYPDRVEDNSFTMYIVFNALASAVAVFLGEKIVWLVRNT